MSLNAYRRAQEIGASPRATEYRLMSQITAEMLAAQEAGMTGAALMPALHRNRRRWGSFASVCAAPAHRLPADLCARIISLALWVDRHTSEVVRGRESIEDLIAINRVLIEGLAAENREAA